MSEELIAEASVSIDAPAAAVWRALTDPELIREYLRGATVETDWSPGSRIVWRGEWEGRPYLDHGTVVEVLENERLVLTHFSPLSGKPDVAENHHELTYSIEPDGDLTRLTLEQDNNATEAEARHSSQNWQAMLEQLRKVAEREQ